MQAYDNDEMTQLAVHVLICSILYTNRSVIAVDVERNIGPLEQLARQKIVYVKNSLITE